MTDLCAVKGHSYGGKFRKPGDVYEATPKHARLLVILGRSVEHVPPPVEKPKRTYTRKTPPKRAYNRKDMQADSE